MKKYTETPLYATLMYDVLITLDVSIGEYFYLDMVHKLSYQRWCSKSLEHCAFDMNISRRGLIKIKNRMLEKGFIEKNLRGHVRVTAKYTEVAVNKVHPPYDLLVNKVPKGVNKVHLNGEQSSLIEINKRITENRESDFGYKKARAAVEALKAKHRGSSTLF